MEMQLIHFFFRSNFQNIRFTLRWKLQIYPASTEPEFSLSSGHSKFLKHTDTPAFSSFTSPPSSKCARHSSVTLPKYPFCMETGRGVRGSDCWQDGAWYSPSHLAPTAPDWLVGRYARKCKIQLDTTRGSPLPLHFIVKREGAKVVCSFLCMCVFLLWASWYIWLKWSLLDV